MKECGVTDYRLLEGLAQGVGEGGDAVNVVGDALYEVTATIGDSGGGADRISMYIVGRLRGSVEYVQPQEFIDAVTPYILLGHLT